MSRENNQDQSLLKHPMIISIVSAVIGGVLGIVGTLLATQISNEQMAHDYVSVNSINTLLQNYLVQPGYVSETILSLETPDKQFEMLGETFQAYGTSVDTTLTHLGYSVDRVSGLLQEDKLNLLPSLAQDISNESAKNASDSRKLMEENRTLKAENENYKAQKTVELVEANLVIDGELMNNGDSVKNAVALVDGNSYFSQTLLNTYIGSHPIKYDSSENAVVYGSQKPEKVKLSWDKTVSDAHGVQSFLLGSGETFTMAKKTYDEGIVVSEGNYMYIHLNGEYSKISFTYGHIDNSSQGNLELTILALDDNGETYTTTLKTITLAGEMEPKDIEVPIGYASAIKIIISDGDYRAQYGLANIYLYS